MKDHIVIRSWSTHAVLFEGCFDTIKQALECAVDQGCNLSHALIEDADLAAVNLDGADMPHARFMRCDLSGANMSEANFIKARFEGCMLDHTCFKQSSLVGAQIWSCTASHADVELVDARNITTDCVDILRCTSGQMVHLAGALFRAQGQNCPFSRGPVLVTGGQDGERILLDAHVILRGQMVLRRDQLSAHPSLRALWTAMRAA